MMAPVQCSENYNRTDSSKKNIYAYNTRNRGTTGLEDNNTRTGLPKRPVRNLETDQVKDHTVPNQEMNV